MPTHCYCIVNASRDSIFGRIAVKQVERCKTKNSMSITTFSTESVHCLIPQFFDSYCFRQSCEIRAVTRALSYIGNNRKMTCCFQYLFSYTNSATSVTFFGFISYEIYYRVIEWFSSLRHEAAKYSLYYLRL